MSWLLRLAQRTKDELVSFIWQFYNDEDRKVTQLRQALEANPPKSYHGQLMIDYQVRQARRQTAGRKLQLLESLLNEAELTGDAKFINTYHQQMEVEREEIKVQELPPNEEESNSFFDEDVLDFYSNDKTPEEHLIPLMDANKIPYWTADFPTGKHVLVAELVDTYVIETSTKGMSISKAADWVADAAERYTEYYPEMNFHQEFWDGVGDGSFLYHATRDENVPLILKDGLEVRSDTRGMSNRYTPPAVFTSDNADDINVYGSAIISIDVGTMKRDGYMPQVEREESIPEDEMKSTLASAIGLEDYYEDPSDSSLSPSTVVIYGNIPPQYLSVYE